MYIKKKIFFVLFRKHIVMLYRLEWPHSFHSCFEKRMLILTLLFNDKLNIGHTYDN